MPELPEVETVRAGIAPLIQGCRVKRVEVRRTDLRWPVPREALCAQLTGGVIGRLARRAKYLLMPSDRGWVIIHLGMAGVLRFLSHPQAPEKHDHADFLMEEGGCLRFSDPRRFGAILWSPQDPLTHPLLANLGPEPLSRAFSGAYLQKRAQARRVAVKNFIMNSAVVAGIGNIYAVEALFAAGIHPARPAGMLSGGQYRRLVGAIQKILAAAIQQGGTTIRDFRNGDGKPGYFSQELQVYGRKGAPCL